MEVYAVRGYLRDDFGDDTFIYLYGIFSTKYIADGIANNLRSALKRDGSNEEIQVEPFNLDEPTDVYYYTIDG